MADIYLGLIIILILSCGLFFFASYIAKSTKPYISNIVILVTMGFLFAYIHLLKDTPYLSWLLPFSNLIILGNWLPLVASFLAGLGWQKIPGSVTRKLVYIIPLLSVCFYTCYGFLFREKPHLENYWKQDICIQTSQSSCGAACASTVLRYYSINSDEREMADLCLTRMNGTYLYGLYRGLKLKTVNHTKKVEIFKWDIDQLRKEISKGPVILQVRLDKNANVDPRYHQRWGWQPGVTHTVVFFGFRDNNLIEIGDPSVGRENWDMEALKVLWHGEGIRLVDK